jgi:hypothetical protein
MSDREGDAMIVASPTRAHTTSREEIIVVSAGKEVAETLWVEGCDVGLSWI